MKKQQARRVLVLDGQGGGMGAQLIRLLAPVLPQDCVLRCVGTNVLATNAMLKAGAAQGATGENAIVVNAGKADVIIGSIAMTMPNEMMGEVTMRMVEAINASEAIKIYIPILPENNYIVSLEEKPLLLQIREAVALIKKELNL